MHSISFSKGEKAFLWKQCRWQLIVPVWRYFSLYSSCLTQLDWEIRWHKWLKPAVHQDVFWDGSHWLPVWLAWQLENQGRRNCGNLFLCRVSIGWNLPCCHSARFHPFKPFYPPYLPPYSSSLLFFQKPSNRKTDDGSRKKQHQTGMPKRNLPCLVRTVNAHSN